MESLKHKNKAVGLKEVKNALKTGRAAIVYLAGDADRCLINPLRKMCDEYNVSVKDVPTKKELGKACGVDVPTAAAVLYKD